MPDPIQSTDILDAALEYVDRGFSVIPVRRTDKRPHLRWEEFQRRLPTREEVESWWKKWPRANVAIICGSISGLYVYDGDGPDGSAWLTTEGPRTSVYSRTGSGGLHAFFAIPRGVVARGKEIARFEGDHNEVSTKGEGGYVVVPPSIHASGNRYEWQFQGKGWDDLPEVNDFAPSTPEGNLALDLSNVKEPCILSLAGVEKGQRNRALTRLSGRWAAKGLELEELLLLARAWNDKNPMPLGDSEILRTVSSIFERHRKKTPEPEACCIQPDEPREIDAKLLRPGGIIQQFMDYFEAGSAASFPLFNMAGAIALLGNLAGQRIMTETYLRTNFYCVSIGFSGTGKNAPLIAIPSLLANTRGNETVGANEITSHAAILTSLSKKPVQILILDEIGHLLKHLKNPNSVAAQVPRLLCDLFSKTGAPYVKSYAWVDDIIIPYHHLSIYGVSTPQRFWEGLTFNDATDGTLARMLIFQSEHDAELPRSNPSMDVPPELTRSIDGICGITPSTCGGNIAQVPAPVIIGKTPKASRVFQEWAMGYHELGNRNKRDECGSSAIYRRAAEHAHKLALVHCLSIHGGAVVSESVDMESVYWATALVDYLVPRTVELIRKNIAANEIDSWQQKILRTVARLSSIEKPGATRREIFKFVRGLTPKFFEQVSEGLLEAGSLATGVHRARNGKELVLYYIPSEHAENGADNADKCRQDMSAP